MSIDNTSPHERLFTVHFKNVGRTKATFDVQVTDLSDDTLDHAMRKGTSILSNNIAFGMPNRTKEGAIYAGLEVIGTFTVTPPTLKDDPDEPT